MFSKRPVRLIKCSQSDVQGPRMKLPSQIYFTLDTFVSSNFAMKMLLFVWRPILQNISISSGLPKTTEQIIIAYWAIALADPTLYDRLCLKK